MSRFNMGSCTVAVVAFIACYLVSMTNAQDPVLDTDGRPVRRGVQYYILPAATDVAGGLTLVDRNGSCPLYVAQEPLAQVTSPGFPVVFSPYAAGETVIRQSRDLTITFVDVATICLQSTSWRVADEDPESGRRLIATGGNASYFTINKNATGIYELAFCPTESCPQCRVRCGSVGILEENNGKALVALDGRPFYFSFRRVQN